MIIATLKRHKAYVTQNRIAVLKVLYESRGSISVTRIRKLAPVGLDRVSVYRTVQFLLEKGLVLTVPNSKGNPHYILKEFLKSGPVNATGDHKVFFICNACGYTEMVEQAGPLVFKTPDDHQVKNAYLVLEGSCSKCRSGF